MRARKRGPHTAKQKRKDSAFTSFDAYAGTRKATRKDQTRKSAAMSSSPRAEISPLRAAFRNTS